MLTIVISQELTGDQIIQKVNDIFNPQTGYAKAKMTIVTSSGKRRTFVYDSWNKNKGEKNLIRYIEPRRVKGNAVLMLNNADDIWMYFPRTQRVRKMDTHAKKQKMQGSDFSYDDVVENRKLLDLYDIEFIGTDSLDDRETYKLQLTAKVDEVNYFSRTIWVDKETYIPLKTELYAKSGKLMKEIMVDDFQRINSHNYPTRVIMVNKLRKDTYTELSLAEILLDAQVPEKVFTKAYLERK